MVDISSQNNKINVTVSSSGNTANTNVTPDYAQYYSEKSKEWAISNRIVDNIDYSSKYYANESKKQADISTAKTTEVIESGNTAVSNIESARNNAITDITNQESLSVDNVNTAGVTQVANVNSEGTIQINLAKEQVTLATNQANIATQQATIATNKTSEVVASGNTALSNIDTAKNNAITSITNQETTSKTSLIDEGATQVGLIQNEGATQVANVQSTGFYMRDDKLYFINSQGEETEFKSGGLPIGTIIPVNATSNYVPDGSLPCDGAEYSKSQFTDLWNNYLSTSLLNTCTYTEYEQDLSTYGQCGKFAIDTANNKFRVPFIKDGAVIQQALTNSELGKSYNAGLPNITGSFNGIISWGGTPATSGCVTAAAGKNTGIGHSGDKHWHYSTASINASLSSSIYGNSDTVQPNAVALRYFVVVANGQINQSMMDWSAWSSSLQGKANTDLSNLSDSGKKVIDGQWVAKEQELSTATAVGTYTIDLSSYLPNDNYNYEIIIGVNYYTSNSTDFNVFITTSIISNMPIARGNLDARKARYTQIIPTGFDRVATLTINDNKMNVLSLIALGYRRIGTNQ